MESGLDISDPTDWHNTRLAALAQVDAALRCQVCKDFFTTPMITCCSHTFCSLCIRRCLASDGQCPTCRSVEQEIKLRRNWAIQEAVDSFQVARGPALEIAKQPASRESPITAQERRGSKRKREGPMNEAQNNGDSIGPRTRGKSRRAADLAPTIEPVPTIDNSDDEDFQPEDDLVACPICDKRMKPEAVFPHLDHCENERKTEQSGAKTIKQSQSQPAIDKAPPERLPQLNYSLFKETSLRKKLHELGIPSWGPKALLMRRHTEWTTIWNANCDSLRPQSKRSLLSSLDVWERSQGGHSANGGTFVQSKVMSKEFDGQEWTQKHKDEYDQLVEIARRRRKGVVDGEVTTTKDLHTNDEKPAPNVEHGNAETHKNVQPTLPTEAQIQKILKTSRPKREYLQLLLDGQGDDDNEHAASDEYSEPPVDHMMLLASKTERDDQKPTEAKSMNHLSESWNAPDDNVTMKPMFDIPAEPIEDAEIVS